MTNLSIFIKWGPLLLYLKDVIKLSFIFSGHRKKNTVKVSEEKLKGGMILGSFGLNALGVTLSDS